MKVILAIWTVILLVFSVVNWGVVSEPKAISFIFGNDITVPLGLYLIILSWLCPLVSYLIATSAIRGGRSRAEKRIAKLHKQTLQVTSDKIDRVLEILTSLNEPVGEEGQASSSDEAKANKFRLSKIIRK